MATAHGRRAACEDRSQPGEEGLVRSNLHGAPAQLGLGSCILRDGVPGIPEPEQGRLGIGLHIPERAPAFRREQGGELGFRQTEIGLRINRQIGHQPGRRVGRRRHDAGDGHWPTEAVAEDEECLLAQHRGWNVLPGIRHELCEEIRCPFPQQLHQRQRGADIVQSVVSGGIREVDAIGPAARAELEARLAVDKRHRQRFAEAPRSHAP